MADRALADYAAAQERSGDPHRVGLERTIQKAAAKIGGPAARDPRASPRMLPAGARQPS